MTKQTVVLKDFSKVGKEVSLRSKGLLKSSRMYRMDGDQGQGHHGAKDQKQGTRNCDALWRDGCSLCSGKIAPNLLILGLSEIWIYCISRLIIGATPPLVKVSRVP